MKYLNIDNKELEIKGAKNTAMEIAGQPNLWINIYNKVVREEKEIKEFVFQSQKVAQKIILTGAGTSAFIGYSIEGIIQRNAKTTVLSLPTTHLVSHPNDYFDSDTPTLLVSFARSGNSPESVATIELAEKHCNVCHHLIITCNPEGRLANYSFKNKSYVFTLPAEADDQSLAMTGSYSGMLLAALLINDITKLNEREKTVNTLFTYGEFILSEFSHIIREVAEKPFKRAVFLGSGPLYGTAMESQLKLQELTDGQVICKHDSYLGFRHGPKAVVDETTIMVYFFSNVDSVLRYEKDLVNGMVKGKTSLFQMGISEKIVEGISLGCELILDHSKMRLNEEYLPVCFILIGQMLGFYKSLNLGLQPDSPSKSGAISRVVEGVVIYEE